MKVGIVGVGTVGTATAPAMIQGVIRVLEPPMSADERSQLEQSAERLRRAAARLRLVTVTSSDFLLRLMASARPRRGNGRLPTGYQGGRESSKVWPRRESLL